jgi:A/G-specific adenine glycosylase
MKFAPIISSWYKDHHRPLPWRETKDPYKIWVSEVILQQTRVSQGIDYYHRFLDSFPDIHALACASEDEVLKVWQGLGYYSRARNMHQAAKTMLENYNGHFPSSFTEIILLKGVGEYIASAVASFAFDLAYPVIDGNVLRFIARLKGIVEPVNTSLGKKMIREILENEIDHNDPALFNQAVMEFGAIICMPQKPACNVCPLQMDCIARNTGMVDKIPVKTKKSAPRPRYLHYIVTFIKKDNQLFTLFKKRFKDDIWKNLYEFPLIELNTLVSWDEIVHRPEFKEMFPGNSPRLNGILKDYRHVLSHRVLNTRCFIVESDYIPEGFLLTGWEQIREFPVSRLMERILEDLNITFHA